MTRDSVDFVRQGAYIALAFVLIQQSEAQSPRSTAIRELFAKVVADKHEDPVARFGATVAQGIIDAGGRNATLSLATRAGTLNMQAIVGVTLFVQFWYWYPLAHGLGMASRQRQSLLLMINFDYLKLNSLVMPSHRLLLIRPRQRRRLRRRKRRRLRLC
jgi:hypothetical protein